MIQLSKACLIKIIPGNKNVDQWYDALSTLLPKYEINTVKRMSAFISQCAHESGNFSTIKENLNYKAATLRRVFPKYFSTDEQAQKCAGKPEIIANIVYANRMGNGSIESGDGYRYCGRGLIQLTGKNNYATFAKHAGLDLPSIQPYLETIKGSTHSACWFWSTNNLNMLADKEDVLSITKRINGGINGLEDRIAQYTRIHTLISQENNAG